PSGREVLARLGGGQGEPAPALPPRPAQGPRPALIGRERHLEALADAYRASREGRPVTLYVAGKSGVGKSTLVQHFLDGLAGQGAVVLAGRCYEQEAVPYKALDILVDSLSRYLGHLPLLEAQALLPRDVPALTRLFPVLRRVEAVARAPRPAGETADPHEVRRRALGALRELLARLGDR